MRALEPHKIILIIICGVFLWEGGGMPEKSGTRTKVDTPLTYLVGFLEKGRMSNV
jgi:hypothetical protein